MRDLHTRPARDNLHLTCLPLLAYTVRSHDSAIRGAHRVNPETQQTVWDYLGRAWQRVDTSRLTLKQKDDPLFQP
jgi:hypothetical protein